MPRTVFAPSYFNRFAIIDLGTNSVRFDVHELEGRNTRTLYREKLMVRLGQDVFESGRLAPMAKTRTLQAYRSFAEKCRALHAKRVFAYATSAIRDAKDGPRFLDILKKDTGIVTEVMPGREEARLISLGIRTGEKDLPERYALVDIGGGSTEISVYQGNRCLFSHSYPLGTARLQQTHLDGARPSEAKLILLRNEIRRVFDAGPTLPAAPRTIGSSGTVRTLIRMARKAEKGKSGRWIRSRLITALMKNITRCSLVELKRVPGMDPRRADMILAGGVLFEECLLALNSKTCALTEITLRDGIRFEVVGKMLASRSPVKSCSSPSAWDPMLLLPLSERFHCEPQHIRRIEGAACSFFDTLASVHRLGRSWRNLIRAASVARDIGEWVNLAQHDRHSAYLLRAVSPPTIPPGDCEIIAELCLYHEAREVRRSELPATWSAKKTSDFVKAVSILRLADAFDSRRTARVLFHSVRKSGRKISIALRRGGVHELDLLWLESKKRLFEEVFNREITFVLN